MEFVGDDHGMQAEVFDAFVFKDAKSIDNLFTSHAVFGFFRRADDVVAAFEERARVVTGADPFRQGAAFFHEVNHRNIVEIDQGTQFHGPFKFSIRRIVGRKDDVVTFDADFVAQFQFRHGTAVSADAFFLQEAHDVRIRRSFDGKIFFEVIGPVEGFDQFTDIIDDGFFVINMERCRVFSNNGTNLFFVKRDSLFVHPSSAPVSYT